MAKFTSEMVIDYADKLLIGLTDEEVKMVLDEFEVIDKNIDIINKIPNINEVSPMTHCLDNFISHFREDEVEESTSVEELFSNCDDYIDDQVRVPRVVEE